MSKKSNPAAIGAFVVGAVALLVFAALIFGGRDLLAPKDRFVSYFNGSVKGLRVGSSVLFRGVQIGYVTDIRLFASVDTLDAEIAVIYEIEANKIEFTRGDRVVMIEDAKSIDDWVAAGLRAQLDSESFVTGQLLIELDFQPDTEPVYRNTAIGYPEIPSVTSGITQAIEDAQRFLSDLQSEIDVKELSARIDSILEGIDELANSEDLRAALAGANELITAEGTQKVPEELAATIANLDGAVTDFRDLLQSTDENIAPVARNLSNTLQEAEKLLSSASTQIDGESALFVQLNATLEEISSAARSVRVLADYLEKNPEALIRGKK